MSSGKQLDLDAIEARAERATKGPWVYSRGTVETTNENPETGDAGEVCALSSNEETHNYNYAEDGDFIAHARDDVPALVARVRELEAEQQATREGVGNLFSAIEGIFPGISNLVPGMGEIISEYRKRMAKDDEDGDA